MKPVKPVTISVKNLASFALPDACPRCQWINAQMLFKLPFQHFPGIFSSIDSYSKKITQLHHTADHKSPPWFEKFGIAGVPQDVPHYSKFSMLDKDTGIVVRGSPDEMLLGPDGLFIPDYKTSRLTNEGDKLMPLYVAQLNTYADIALSQNMGPIAGLGLIYYEPVTDLVGDGSYDAAATLVKVADARGFSMYFEAKFVKVERDTKLTAQLLKKFKAMRDLLAPPARSPDCKDCPLLDTLSELGRVTQANPLAVAKG